MKLTAPNNMLATEPQFHFVLIADRSRSLDFPDFTKGKWKTTPPIKLMGV